MDKVSTRCTGLVSFADDDSPYRATEPLTGATPIARARSSWLFEGVLFVSAIAALGALVSGFTVVAGSIGVGVALVGGLRLVERVGLHGGPGIDADERGVRVRCSEAALAQVLEVDDPRQVDLFIPWDECLSIDARPQQFGDDLEMALVITTPQGLVAVRPVFSTEPMQIALRLHEVRRQLALAPDDDRLA